MKILILTRKKEVYSVRRLIEEGQKSGHEVIILDPDDPEVHKIQGNILIPRIGNFKYQESLAVLEWFERRGMKVLTKTARFRDARNKWFSYLILRDEEIPQPSTRTCMKHQLPHQFPYIVKRPESCQGQGIWLIERKQDLLSLPTGEEYLVQEFIHESKGRDIRAFVVKDQVIGSIERVAQNGEFRSNLSLGAIAQPVILSEEEKRIAILATKSLGLIYAGVDLIRSIKGPLVLEVNASPGFEGIETCLKINVAQVLIETCEEL